MSDDDPYISNPQQLLLRVLDILSGAALESTTREEVSRALAAGGDTPSRDQVFRALKNLEHSGWAEQTRHGWRLTRRLTRISERLRLAIADLHRAYLGQGDE